MSTLHSLVDGRLVLVTGKGGTGKTTMAAALAILAAQRGRRAVLVEVDVQQPSLDAIFRVRLGSELVGVRPRLDIGNLEWRPCLADAIRRLVPVGRVVQRILDHPVIQQFLDFTPGSREVVMLSAIAHLADTHDIVVVDMPASGHAFALLDVMRSVEQLFRSGPIRDHIHDVRGLFDEESTHLVFVSLPEEMVVTETLETYERLREVGLLGGGESALILNRSASPTLTVAESEALSKLEDVPDLSVEGRSFVDAGLWERDLEAASADALRRLEGAFTTEPILVPPAVGAVDPAEVVGAVAVHLGRRVGVTRRELQWR